VEKHDGRSEPFDRAKLLRGLARACSKRDVPGERLEALVIEIEARLARSRGRGNDPVESGDIGRLALAGLRELDDVAYVRFASVYRAFENVEEFRDVLDAMGTTANSETEFKKVP
jgi:transcriptional repressor NrdR